jgi:CxxC motif-containing protein (DUF1111 family)
VKHLWFLLLVACGDNDNHERFQGGDITSFDRGPEALKQPIASLTEEQLDRHNLGRGPFTFVWTPPQLGPLFNHNACVACHAGNGRGESQIGPDVFGSQALIRVSQDTGEPEVPGGQIPVPGFGLQLQDHATFDIPEVRVTLTWSEIGELFDDGELIMLREPRIEVKQFNGAPMPQGIHMSYRQAPPLIGLGLLEAITDDDLLAAADPDDLDGDGISGRPNIAWDEEAQTSVIGRFGHKASVPRLIEQVAGAFANDMGLTNRIFPDIDPNAPLQDVNDKQLVDSGFHIATLAVPGAAERDGESEHGRVLFDDFGCASCHTPTHVTGAHEIFQLSNQRIHPYTDLLLHDVGDRLTDTRDDFLASGLEWRTPPLWGIGLAQQIAPATTFLHDGRARTVAEAIMWHGGEADAAKQAFRGASKADRDALLAFLATL